MQVVRGYQVDGRMLTRRQFAEATTAACLAGASLLLGGCASSSSGSGASSSEASSESSTAPPGKPSGTTVGELPKVAQQFKEISTTLFAFDTVVTLRASCAQETLDALADRCQYFESIFSRTIETSDIGRINAAGGKPVEVAPETAEIVQKALAYCAEGDGLLPIN